MTNNWQISRRNVLRATAAGSTLAFLPAFAGSAAAAQAPEPMFDSHAHLVSPDLAKYPRVPDDAPNSAASFPPQDFKQLGTQRPLPETEAMLGWMKGLGVVGAAAVQKRGTYGTDNRYILDSALRHPTSLFPVVVLDAPAPDTPAKIIEWARKGLSGVRFTGVMEPDGSFPWMESDSAFRAWDAANKANVVVDLMPFPFGHPPEALPAFAALAARFPGVRMVIDHINWPRAAFEPSYGLDEPTRALAAYPNVFFKFTTLNIDKLQDSGVPTAAFLKHAVDVLGTDRIMWGSDMGNSPGTYPELVGRGRAAARLLTPEERRALLHDNGRRVFASTAR